jgi:CRISPR/Cas system-associated endoribonuclease Cas2
MAVVTSVFKCKITVETLKSIKVNHLMQEHNLNCDLSSQSLAELTKQRKIIVKDSRNQLRETQIINVFALCRF